MATVVGGEKVGTISEGLCWQIASEYLKSTKLSLTCDRARLDCQITDMLPSGTEREEGFWAEDLVYA